MSFLANLLGVGDAVKSVGQTMDNLFTSDEERVEKQNERMKAEREFNYLEAKLMADQNLAQMEVNKVEAASSSLFVAGWRPAIGWIGAASLGYQFILYPLMSWVPGLTAPKPLDADLLWTIIAGMLGIGTMRSFDKWQGKETKRIGA